MRKFVQRALKKLSKLDEPQIRALIRDLARSNEQMETVLDSLSHGVLVTDRDGRIILVNKAAERLLPIREQENAIIWEVISDLDIADCIQAAIKNKELVRDQEFTLPDRGRGRGRILALSIMPLVRRRQIHGTVVHVEDISDKRLREARLRRAENLASLTNLTAGVAHEIKNPLGSVSIHIQLMQRLLENEKEKNTELHKHLNVVSEEVERLNRIVLDFLFAVRPMDINLMNHDLNILLYEALEFLKYELAEAKIKLLEKYQTDIPHILLDEKFSGRQF